MTCITACRLCFPRQTVTGRVVQFGSARSDSVRRSSVRFGSKLVVNEHEKHEKPAELAELPGNFTWHVSRILRSIIFLLSCKLYFNSECEKFVILNSTCSSDGTRIRSLAEKEKKKRDEKSWQDFWIVRASFTKIQGDCERSESVLSTSRSADVPFGSKILIFYQKRSSRALERPTKHASGRKLRASNRDSGWVVKSGTLDEIPGNSHGWATHVNAYESIVAWTLLQVLLVRVWQSASFFISIDYVYIFTYKIYY